MCHRVQPSNILTKRDITQQKKTDEQREAAIRQIINGAVVSDTVVDIFDAVGLDKPNIGLLDDEFLAQVKNLPEKNLAVELLERLLEGEIKAKFATNVVQQKKFSDLLANVITRYQNRSIETAQVMEELVEMAKNYNPVTYTAVVNMEHVRGITADPPFQSLGKVLSLKTPPAWRHPAQQVLCVQGHTKLLKGFKSKQGKSFDAVVAFDGEYNTTFVFPEKKCKSSYPKKRK